VSAVRDDSATIASAAMSVRDDGATTCPVCGVRFEALGRQRFCGTPCRQTGWRRRRAAPVEPVVAKSDTVYECEGCGSRYLGIQRCDDCNTWCRRLGPGGPCPHCDEPVSVSDLLAPDQLATTKIKRR